MPRARLSVAGDGDGRHGHPERDQLLEQAHPDAVVADHLSFATVIGDGSVAP